MKVLIADDDVLIRYALMRSLTEVGHDTAEAADGFAVIAACHQDRPDLIILDLMMPGCNGFQVLRWLRQNDPLRAIAVIVLSAFVVEPAVFDDYDHVIEVLQKPLLIDSLYRSIDGYAERERAAA